MQRLFCHSRIARIFCTPDFEIAYHELLGHISYLGRKFSRYKFSEWLTSTPRVLSQGIRLYTNLDYSSWNPAKYRDLKRGPCPQNASIHVWDAILYLPEHSTSSLPSETHSWARRPRPWSHILPRRTDKLMADQVLGTGMEKRRGHRVH
jgi:hypothetical protein